MKTLRGLILLISILCSMNIYGNSSINCLSEAGYIEAEGEGLKGIEAVMIVILNRVKRPHQFTNSICGVIHQRGQFPWASIPHRRMNTTNKVKFDNIANMVYNTYFIKNELPKDVVKLKWLKEALFFSMTNPSRYRYLGTIKNHSFYTTKT